MKIISGLILGGKYLLNILTIKTIAVFFLLFEVV